MGSTKVSIDQFPASTTPLQLQFLAITLRMVERTLPLDSRSDRWFYQRASSTEDYRLAEFADKEIADIQLTDIKLQGIIANIQLTDIKFYCNKLSL